MIACRLTSAFTPGRGRTPARALPLPGAWSRHAAPPAPPPQPPEPPVLSHLRGGSVLRGCLPVLESPGSTAEHGSTAIVSASRNVGANHAADEAPVADELAADQGAGPAPVKRQVVVARILH
jgi:hypothetical protein